MMTPEARARAVVSEPDWWRPPPDFLIDFDRLRAHIAHAIAFDRGYTINAAINDKLEEVAVKLEARLGIIVATTEAAGLVRAMKEH